MAVSVQKLDQAEQEIVKKINRGDETAFKNIFFEYYNDLCLLAQTVVKSNSGAENVVQNVFLNIWESRKKWEIKISIKSYLFRAVKNRAINYNKKHKRYRKAKKKYKENLNRSVPNNGNSVSSVQKNIADQIWDIVEKMPERRQLVFTLHQKNGLTYKEIGLVMDISHKTVENHMGLALKQIRKEINLSTLRS